MWDYLSDQIGRAVETTDEITLEEIREKLLAGHMQLWLNRDLVCITQISNYHNSKYLSYIILAGKNLDQHYHQDVIRDWARSHGCQGEELYGRIGWMRKLKDFKPVRVLMRKEYE